MDPVNGGEISGFRTCSRVLVPNTQIDVVVENQRGTHSVTRLDHLTPETCPCEGELHIIERARVSLTRSGVGRTTVQFLHDGYLRTLEGVPHDEALEKVLCPDSKDDIVQKFWEFQRGYESSKAHIISPWSAEHHDSRLEMASLRIMSDCHQYAISLHSYLFQSPTESEETADLTAWQIERPGSLHPGPSPGGSDGSAQLLTVSRDDGQPRPFHGAHRPATQPRTDGYEPEDTRQLVSARAHSEELRAARVRYYCPAGPTTTPDGDDGRPSWRTSRESSTAALGPGPTADVGSVPPLAGFHANETLQDGGIISTQMTDGGGIQIIGQQEDVNVNMSSVKVGRGSRQVLGNFSDKELQSIFQRLT